jgi:CDP-diacylglycerol--serine O-phosphatidyltransferase
VKTQLDGLKPADFVTLASLGAGTAGTLFALSAGAQNAGYAFAAIVAAAALDFADGAVARSTGGASELGKELDSLADLVSFGVAPAAMVFASKASLNPAAVGAVALAYVACAATRLARFNLQQEKKAFYGLPSPVAGIITGATAMFAGGIPAMAAALACAALMITTLKVRKISL